MCFYDASSNNFHLCYFAFWVKTWTNRFKTLTRTNSLYMMYKIGLLLENVWKVKFQLLVSRVGEFNVLYVSCSADTWTGVVTMYFVGNGNESFCVIQEYTPRHMQPVKLVTNLTDETWTYISNKELQEKSKCR